MNSRPSITPRLLPKLLALAAFLISTQVTFAQAPDSITHHYDSLAKIKLHELDSSGNDNKLNRKIDDTQQRVNNILNPDFNQLTSRLRKKKLEPTDTIQASHELDSLKSGLHTKIDSLKGLNLPADQYTRKLDSLNNISPQKYIDLANAKIQSAENKLDKPVGDLESKLNKPVNDLESKINKPIDNVESKINKPVDNIESKVNDKLNVMRQEGGDKANIPGNLDSNMSLDKAGLPKTDLNKGLGVNTGIDKSTDSPLGNTIDKPSVDNPLGKIDNPVSGQTEQLGELKDKVNDVRSVPQQQIDKVRSIDEVKTAQDKLGDANQITDKAQSYSGDVRNIASGNFDDTKSIQSAAEQKAGELSEVKDLGKQTAQINEAKGMIDKGKDPEAMKNMAKQQVRKQAIDHFKGKEQVLQAAMDKLSKIKAKYPEVTSLKDLPKRPPNPMKGKPFIERIVPGLTIQFQKTNNWLIDLNPVLAYRFSGRINAGLGWNERLSFAKWNRLSPPDRIYGPRMFGSFGFKKGFSVKAEVEKMNALIPLSAMSSDGSRQWVWSAFVGLKKDYKFMGTVRGNMQILYNMYDDHDNSPYADRLNVRMGFEFPMKKVKKPTK